ncbi:isoprenylcysteine carboxylmethyltransferase family protein [Nocardioides sp. TF02-7]|uniref:methyltransferase family protein n=1 Tax=Nocardioides sp. TF02-7 TaxID=2917724 RepID=UPI001F059C2E|nr:isoprenylcysteine carboxylmethyltransferase family protein [Nocardioides sp. TF02-7]UMG94907.1 isoprenylcysteine carboxylmethyltransferase family protein [Nocardioides sp. TF02-7]
MGMEVAALGLLALYVLVGFGIRTVVQVRRTGDSGFRGLSGSPGTAEWWAGILFAAALLTAVLGPGAGLLGLEAVGPLADPRVAVLGIGLTLLGIVGTFLTQLSMGDNWRVGVDEDEHTALVTHGPFALVRNPIFTAMIVTGAGIALIVPNVIALLGWIVLVVAIELQVRVVEEPYLLRHHGDDYRGYLASVGRFLPAVGLQPGRRDAGSPRASTY